MQKMIAWCSKAGRGVKMVGVKEDTEQENLAVFFSAYRTALYKFLDVFETKVFRVFLLAIRSYLRILLPTPLSKSGWNWFVM